MMRGWKCQRGDDRRVVWTVIGASGADFSVIHSLAVEHEECLVSLVTLGVGIGCCCRCYITEIVVGVHVS